ncbi:hypothetical protein [Extibacter muris]|uniref:hypothetical protein n=1 Tax=Extibacter muris TaxID=1796622 RepID=UPI00210DE27A|nr:hypothetical protein [Extibacter muris]
MLIFTFRKPYFTTALLWKAEFDKNRISGIELENKIKEKEGKKDESGKFKHK